MKKITWILSTLYSASLFCAPPDPNYIPPNVESYLNPPRPAEEVLQDTYPQGVNKENPTPYETKLSSAQTASKAQAIYWLTLLDQKRYPAAYAQAGEIFRAIISSKIWSAAMENLRAPLGNPRSRKVSGTKNLTNLGGLDGEFISITFTTEFSRGGGSLKETVILSSLGGQWKTVGYQVD